ncbi:MAG: HEAT repeat domain-containing protein [Methylococcaceae bacterium]|nr:HEAT repeat domain-containing protein [Methylococcaceae bacterium]MDP3020177.1 HEAT repeat domain-containing protein [Methylococcaceae bacterium]MDP3390717.1 HEAT repeat domain-containing protein [Methylococcaceae bacterium]MDZ4156605.1 HEAT repeat domain-containing protein [Methylococcales bacterium]
MNTPRTLALFACLVLHATGGFAAAQDVSNSSPASIQLTLSQQAPDAIRLEARHAPLGKILKAIADKTGVSIHYSVLPDAPVTATCIGENVSQIMDCLLAKQVGLVAHKAQKDKPAEFWLLGSSVGSCQAVTVEPTAPLAQAVVEKKPTAAEQAQVDQSMREQSDLLLEQAKSKDPGERAQAIYNLGLAGLKDDPSVDKAIQSAMIDKDPGIRAQAVTAIVQRGGNDVEAFLTQAINDKDVNVRFNAVSTINDDVNLLQQASKDNDKGIRELASAKLAELNARQKQ